MLIENKSHQRDRRRARQGNAERKASLKLKSTSGVDKHELLMQNRSANCTCAQAGPAHEFANSRMRRRAQVGQREAEGGIHKSCSWRRQWSISPRSAVDRCFSDSRRAAPPHRSQNSDIGNAQDTNSRNEQRAECASVIAIKQLSSGYALAI